MNPHLLTELRKCCISNNNLANIFDKLQIGNLLLHGYNPNDFLKPKQKADVVESLIGLSSFFRFLLNEFF
jgi:dsRNA-specific ribonuclease